MKRKTIVAAVLIAMTIGGGTAVLAGREPEGACDQKQNGMHRERLLQRMTKVLKLSDAQQKEIKSLLSAERVASEPLMGRMEEKRKQLWAAGESATFDEASVRSIAAAMGEIRTELAVIRVKTRTQIHAVLTPEQRDLAKSLKPFKEHAPRSRHHEGMPDGDE